MDSRKENQSLIKNTEFTLDVSNLPKLDEIKKLLNFLCTDLQSKFNYDNKAIHKVELFSEIRDVQNTYGYFKIGHEIPKERLCETALFVEIKVNNKCIFRESYLLNKYSNIEVIERFLLDRLLKNVFTYGVLSANSILNRRNIR